MTGHVIHQIGLVRTLEAYESAQRAADLFPVPAQQDKAEKLYMQLLKIALACGFEPGGMHGHLTTYEWATIRAETIRRVFPVHIEARAA